MHFGLGLGLDGEDRSSGGGTDPYSFHGRSDSVSGASSVIRQRIVGNASSSVSGASGIVRQRLVGGAAPSVSSASGTVRQRLVGGAAPSISGGNTSPFYVPLIIPGNLLLLDSALGVHLNAGHVSALDDQSFTGDANKNATQAIAIRQPTYIASNANYN